MKLDLCLFIVMTVFLGASLTIDVQAQTKKRTTTQTVTTQTATTEDGRKVILKSNGTWQYDKEPDACAFCGTWEYVGVSKGWQDIERYLKITQVGAGKFKIAQGYADTERKILWDDGVHVRNRWCGISGSSGASYLKMVMVNGRLVGSFITCNWLYSTNGYETTYKITFELISHNKMRYSVWSAMSGGKPVEFVATKISN